MVPPSCEPVHRRVHIFWAVDQTLPFPLEPVTERFRRCGYLNVRMHTVVMQRHSGGGDGNWICREAGRQSTHSASDSSL